jgi:hypothetical protein
MPTESDVRALLLFRGRALAAYEAWEHRQPRRPAPPDVFAQLDAIRLLLPPEVRAPRINADRYAGVRRMQQCLAVLEVPH